MAALGGGAGAQMEKRGGRETVARWCAWWSEQMRTAALYGGMEKWRGRSGVEVMVAER